MNPFHEPHFRKLEASPLLVRVVPFAVFVALTFCQGQFGDAGRFWFYLAKTGIGAWLIWTVRPWVVEMKWSCSWEAVVAGVAVFAIWVGLDGFYPKLGKTSANWDPHSAFGRDSALAWMFVAVRILGSSIVVPPLEEIFYRSFLYRYIAKPDFQSVPLGQFSWTPFLATSVVFGLAHQEWLAGILCGFAYQSLVCRKKRLGDAISAHAVTNFLLGVWIVWKGAWHFW